MILVKIGYFLSEETIYGNKGDNDKQILFYILSKFYFTKKAKIVSQKKIEFLLLNLIMQS